MNYLQRNKHTFLHGDTQTKRSVTHPNPHTRTFCPVLTHRLIHTHPQWQWWRLHRHEQRGERSVRCHEGAQLRRHRTRRIRDTVHACRWWLHTFMAINMWTHHTPTCRVKSLNIHIKKLFHGPVWDISGLTGVVLLQTSRRHHRCSSVTVLSSASMISSASLTRLFRLWTSYHLERY